MTALSEEALTLLNRLQSLLGLQDEKVRSINKIHNQLNASAATKFERNLEHLKEKLHQLYADAKRLAEEEYEVAERCIQEIEGQPAVRQPAQQKRKPEVVEGGKKKRLKTEANGGGRRSSPSGSPPSGKLSSEHGGGVFPGTQVAARISGDNAERDEWIVVKVVRHDREAACYDVVDEEPGEEEEVGPRHYRLPAAAILPFPKKTDQSQAPEFPQGSLVLAVYPSTTALYRAKVVSRRARWNDDYVLEFDDDEEEGMDGVPRRHVPFHNVVQLPEGHKQ